jgi:excisionase family DNA binding protein
VEWGLEWFVQTPRQPAESAVTVHATLFETICYGMGYSLREAAKELGVSKPTVQRAIKSGRLSATRRDDGSYDIDPAELRRAFPAVTRNSNVAPDLKRGETPGETRVLQAEIDGLREQVALLKDERDDLRRRLDAEAEERRRVTALLTDQRPAAQPAARRGWWRRLVGK